MEEKIAEALTLISKKQDLQNKQITVLAKAVVALQAKNKQLQEQNNQLVALLKCGNDQSAGLDIAPVPNKTENQKFETVLQKPKVINVYGGQNVGQKTFASELCAKLNSLGQKCIVAEEVERTSDPQKNYQAALDALKNCTQTSGIIITKNPILMCEAQRRLLPPVQRNAESLNLLTEDCKKVYNAFDNINILLTAKNAQRSWGSVNRFSVETALVVDVVIEKTLRDFGIDYLKDVDAKDFLALQKGVVNTPVQEQ